LRPDRVGTGRVGEAGYAREVQADQRLTTGASGEDAAVAAYRRRGFRTVARNWRCRAGELDLVVGRGRLLVICEVKTRRGTAFGGGYEAVTWTKRRKLRQLAELFLATSGLRPADVRFDVASVLVHPTGETDVEIFEDAF
jgi:putative endonuclease